MPILTEEERVGTLLAGRYRIDSILGRGGTGVVFDATHSWTGRRVAVKLLRPEYSRDLSLTRRFLQEARAAANLVHPNVVSVLDMGNEDDGAVHLVLERLEGESLGAYLTREKTLTPREALAILVPIMDALCIAHRQGIVHRDLKPDNIYLHHDTVGRRVPKLLDFGMAKMVDAAWGTSTQTGTLIGTPFYMSPEQAEGRKGQGPASDVWSMGVIFYRCLTGVLPFWADTPTKLLIEIVKGESRPVRERAPTLPEPLAAAIDRALAPDVAFRHADMAAFVDALRDAAAASDIPFPAPPEPIAVGESEVFDPGPVQRPHDEAKQRRAARVRLATWSIATAIAVLIGGGLYLASTPRGTPSDRTVVADDDAPLAGAIHVVEVSAPAETLPPPALATQPIATTPAAPAAPMRPATPSTSASGTARRPRAATSADDDSSPSMRPRMHLPSVATEW